MSVALSALLGKTYSIVNTSTSIANGASYTETLAVGFGYRGGMANLRSNYALSSGGVAGVIVVLRGTDSSVATASSAEIQAYPQVFNRLIDSSLSNPMFSSGSTLVSGVRLVNAWYDAALGTVNFSFTNTGLGTSQTLLVRINGIIY